MILSFVFYMGFDFIGDSGVPYFLEKILTWLGIEGHYSSISRGVIDLRDLLYFAGMTILFLWAATLSIRKIRLTFRRFRQNLVLIVVVLAGLFIVSGFLVVRIDLTAEKRYSVSQVTKNLVGDLEKPVDIELFLAGELPPGFRKLQQEIAEKVADINLYASKPIRIKITDPYREVPAAKRDQYFRELADLGIRLTDLRQTTDAGVTTRLIFPGALVTQGTRKLAVNFLKNNPLLNWELNLNHSIESIEFELSDAIRKFSSSKKPVLAFLEGQGEFSMYEVGDLSASLLDEYEVVRVTIEELVANNDKISCLIIAGPVRPFQEMEKLVIDQYIMQGGKTIWLVDPVQVSIDSLTTGQSTLAFPRDLNINDQLFRYGVRLNYDLLQDVNCSKLLVNTALQGNSTRFSPQPWYYYPLLTPSGNHPLSRNLNLVQSEFVSSCDTVSGGGTVRKTVILSTSPYARRVRTPAKISLQNINNPPARELFNQQFIPAGLLLEGSFLSVFRNRVVDEYNPWHLEVIGESKPTGMIVISDAGIIANKVRFTRDKPSYLPLGFDRITQQTYGNKEFLVNAIRYLHDNHGIMQLRNQTVKLRLLDKVRLREERLYWQLLNVVLPLVLIVLIGVAYQYFRKYKFGKT